MKKEGNNVLVWDPFIRFFHWSMVLAFAVAWASAEEMLSLHEKTGYFILILICLRLIWGLTGTGYARFSNFIYTPEFTKNYLKRVLKGNAESYTGHNPAGGWMIVFLLISLLAVVATGILMEGGQMAYWEEVHEVSANFVLLLIIIHIAGVFLSSVLHKENLIKAMITGKKNGRTQ